jgi:hypothetical protein
MEEVGRDGEQIVISASREELRLLAATLVEALNGAYAIPSDEWGDLVGASREQVRALLDELVALHGR